MDRLQGKVAIITGGAKGIGRAMAELFAEHGAQVVVGDIEPADTSTPLIEFQHLDVTKLESWENLVNRVINTYGRIDILVNNAGGVGSYEPIHSIPLAQWEGIINLNQNSVFYGMRTVIPEMLERKTGSIINVSSIWGIAGVSGVAAYQASKAAVRMMSKNAALSYATQGIRVNSLHPGLTSTPMISAQDAAVTQSVIDATPLGRAAEPREVAYAALFLASDESSYVTGTELVVDGGFTAP